MRPNCIVFGIFIIVEYYYKLIYEKLQKKTLHTTMFVYGKERLGRFMFVKNGITSFTRENGGK